ncbi:unnamed protein product [Porites evermanni]|uniref:Integrase catalytic domain-containing protein n=1 Tax=Porites evermanni TaxID=104178 RepID=A0ABN8QU74_9CNID|nr:unnamed protein product [Porites evermanni]
MEAAVQHLRRLEWALDLTRPFGGDLLELIINQVKQLECKIGEMIETFNGLIPLLADELRYRAPVTATRSVGRPSFIITKEQLEIMRSYGLSWMDIAKALGVSVSTIWRRRAYFQIRRSRHRGRREITMTELKEIIARIKETAVDAGIIMIEGELSGQGLYASRVAISEALMTLDPIGASLRWRDFTSRVKYNVPGPNSLWHLDGNHKPMRWRLVIHGGIDGYSRLAVYLKCSDNNRAETVGNSFLAAAEEYCWPSRVRTDKGGENAVVARLMIERWGEGRGSILQGSSVHNQRIERLWRDVRKMVSEYYRRLFYFLESHLLLGPIGEVDLFSLHFVFIPRINNSLSQFRASWNNHKLSTEGKKKLQINFTFLECFGCLVQTTLLSKTSLKRIEFLKTTGFPSQKR